MKLGVGFQQAYARALENLERGDAATAERELREIQRRWPGEVNSRRVLAVSLLAQGSNAEGIGLLEAVVAAAPDFAHAMVDLARAMQGSRASVFLAVNLPHAMPAIFSGLKVSVTLAVVGAVVGEFVGSNSGIGYVLQRSIGTFDLPTMFAALVILALLGVVLFWVVDRIERLVIPWHVSQRQDVIFAA